jgi:glutaminase
MPDSLSLQEIIEVTYHKYKNVQEGKLATYIPELGAIAVASLIKQDSQPAGVREFVEKMGGAAGRRLEIDSAVLASELTTGNRNRAIAYLMLNFGGIDEDVNHTLHQYFSQCSLLVSCRDLAIMAATLANMGTNPVTREPVFNFEFIKDVLAVMFTCGLYDHAGEWAYSVGLPAKSGVGGGLLAVVNRQLALQSILRAWMQRAIVFAAFSFAGTGQPPGPARVRV